MRTFHISHTTEETKRKNIALYTEVRENGKFMSSEWQGDYLVATYEYNDKIYELWDNMEYGIMSAVYEYEKEEYKNEKDRAS